MIRKAVIPAAGLGTRFLPATKAMPKEMLPIVDKPTIQYIVEEAVQSGIEDIIIVTGRNKRSIEDHFDKNVELELSLAKKQKTEILQALNDITNISEIHYVRQKEPLGLGHAVWSARKFIGSEPFALLLGDIIIESEPPCLKQLMDVYKEYRTSVLAIEAIGENEIGKFGVIAGTETKENLYQVDRLVEKPRREPPSNLAMVGRYILTPGIFTLLESTTPGQDGEVQLTDALNELTKAECVLAYRYRGRHYDIGSKLGFLKANFEFAYKNSELMGEFDCHVRKFLSSAPETSRSWKEE